MLIIQFLIGIGFKQALVTFPLESQGSSTKATPSTGKIAYLSGGLCWDRTRRRINHHFTSNTRTSYPERVLSPPG